jgi:hypothetical protein
MTPGILNLIWKHILPAFVQNAKPLLEPIKNVVTNVLDSTGNPTAKKASKFIGGGFDILDQALKSFG